MIKKLKFLLLCLISSPELRGMEEVVQEEFLPQLTNKRATKGTAEKLKTLIQNNQNLQPVKEIYDLLEKASNLKVKPAFSLWEKIKAIFSLSYKIPNKTLIEKTTEIYFEHNQNPTQEMKKKDKEALIKTLYLIALDQTELNTIKKKTGDFDSEAEQKFHNDEALIPLKYSFIEKYRGHALVAGGAIAGCIVTHCFVRNLEFQPATLIKDEKIIPLGIKGICIKLMGLLSGAALGAMLEWKNLSTSITSKLKEQWNLKERIEKKVKEIEEQENIGKKRKSSYP